MREHALYLRKCNGICEKISINPQATIGELKQRVSSVLQINISSFQLTFKGMKIPSLKNDSTLDQYGIHNSSIIQLIILTNFKQDQVFAIFLQYQADVKMIHISPNTTVSEIHYKASHLLNIVKDSFDIVWRDTKLFDKQMACNQLQISEGEVLVIEKRRFITNLIQLSQQQKIADQRYELMLQGNQIKSIHSQHNHSQNNHSEQQEYSEIQRSLSRKQYRSEIIQKTSDVFSPPNAKKGNIFMNLNQIKQTVSFGSLEEDGQIEIGIDIYNCQGTKYYKLICLRETTCTQLRKKIAKLQQVSVDQIDISGLNDRWTIDQLQRNSDNQIILIFKANI